MNEMIFKIQLILNQNILVLHKEEMGKNGKFNPESN